MQPTAAVLVLRVKGKSSPANTSVASSVGLATLQLVVYHLSTAICMAMAVTAEVVWAAAETTLQKVGEYSISLVCGIVVAGSVLFWGVCQISMKLR
jgi:hypothetical protein